jgi:hypothetical protein
MLVSLIKDFIYRTQCIVSIAEAEQEESLVDFSILHRVEKQFLFSLFLACISICVCCNEENVSNDVVLIANKISSEKREMLVFLGELSGILSNDTRRWPFHSKEDLIMQTA